MLQQYNGASKYIIHERSHPEGVIDYRIVILICLIAIIVCIYFKAVEKNKKR
jgi:hypothetical protein